LAVAAAVIGSITLSSMNAAAEVSSSASASAASSRSAAASAKASKAKAEAELDRSIKDLAAAMEKSIADASKADRVAIEKEGWKYVSDYLCYAMPDGDYSCPSRYACGSMTVTNNKEPDGCLRGLSINVSFLSSSGLSVYNTARSTGALHPGEQAQVDFTDQSGNGTTIRVDSMRCY
jgi:uncharacterized membrane protein